MASEFCGHRFPNGQIEEISGMRRVIEVAVEPPLLKGIVGQRCHGSIIVWECFEGDIESPHSRGEYRCERG